MKRGDSNIFSYNLKLLVILICILESYFSFGQTDPIFSQYLTNVQSINPAYCGMWDKGNIQMLLKKYYVGVTDAPLNQSVSFYTPIRNENNGVGFNVIYDLYGYARRLSFTGDYSYKVKLSMSHFLRLGLKAGVLNFSNALNDYNLDPNNFPDVNFQEDVDIKYMATWGVGAFMYTDDYYISLSIPQIIKNSFKENRSNYSSLAEVRYVYLTGGYVYQMSNDIVLKPSLLIKAAKGTSLQLDLSANVIFLDKFWIGMMYRTNKTMAFIAQWVIKDQFRLGYAIDYSISKDIKSYQLGTHELMLSYEFDLYKRTSYSRQRYF